MKALKYALVIIGLLGLTTSIYEDGSFRAGLITGCFPWGICNEGG